MDAQRASFPPSPAFCSGVSRGAFFARVDSEQSTNMNSAKGSDQPAADGDRDGFGRGLGTELLPGGRDIGFQRTRTQLESLGDGWQTLTVCQTLQHH